MRYLFILLFCTAACAESPSEPTTGQLPGVRPAKGGGHAPSGEPAPPKRDPQLRPTQPESVLDIELDGVTLADEAELDDATDADLERCKSAVNADARLQYAAVTRTCGRISVTLYPTAD